MWLRAAFYQLSYKLTIIRQNILCFYLVNAIRFSAPVGSTKKDGGQATYEADEVWKMREFSNSNKLVQDKRSMHHMNVCFIWEFPTVY